MAVAISERTLEPLERLCTRNVSRALIERPYSREPQAVGAVYDRPGFFVQSPLERHRLTAFYEDGEEHMKGAMQMREITAMAQYLSDTPIKPYQVIRELFQNAYANR